MVSLKKIVEDYIKDNKNVSKKERETLEDFVKSVNADKLNGLLNFEEPPYFPSEVRMMDPKLSFRCKDKMISLKRKSGGNVIFELVGFTNWKMNYLKFAYIQTPEQFEKLWEFLGGDKELPKEDTYKYPPIKRPKDISGLPI
jgi:hypothetical protein